MNTARFLPPILSRHPFGLRVAEILAAAIHAVEPAAALRRFVRREGHFLWAARNRYDLDAFRRLYLLAVGKAAAPMSAALIDLLGDRLEGGLLIPKQPYPAPGGGFTVQAGNHPIPGADSLQAGQAALALAESLGAGDLLICLISGGGSALMSAPLPGLSLADMQALTAELLACGARIDEINTLRRHLDRVKGGNLARAAAPAQVLSLILSDVVGSPLEAIASGPTAPDLSTRADALGVLARYGLESRLPSAVLDALRRSPETPKPGDPRFEDVQNVLIGDNALALDDALGQAAALCFHTQNLGSRWQGEARAVAEALCEKLLTTNLPRPFCLAAGGETTVTLRGTGLGGRNQELALAAVERLAGRPDVMLITLATDGEDGPTDAAGAVVTGETQAQAAAQGFSPADFLARNDAFRFFEPLGALLRTGPTGTNVNDITFLFGF
ncbi:MAG: glycerate kinase [Anaerolineales bacterium]